MTDEVDSKGIHRDLRPLPPELNFVVEASARRINSPDVDDFYGISENSTNIRVFHGTRDCKLPMIAEEGLKAFVEHSRILPKIYVTANPILAARHAVYEGPHDTLRKRGEIPEESVVGSPVLLMIQADRKWMRAHPDSQKPVDSPYLETWSGEGWEVLGTRIAAFEKRLRGDVEALKLGDELSSFGLPFPIDQIPPRFIYVVQPEGNIPIDQYSIVTNQAAA